MNNESCTMLMVAGNIMECPNISKHTIILIILTKNIYRDKPKMGHGSNGKREYLGSFWAFVQELDKSSEYRDRKVTN
ncbi:hypothetical protein SPOG_00939 [Schizosaccharomyces cryophilus OY26]|uniref:Uncharacterized protein n=1 Tax=Schizosaccharomyces cryophilus (strain OY26 / ATCC MYA-4695 / CBS 11777 / NBRC 106824 / NRRL Y48691) TaxID=653667 RepID=S9VQD6_SCHCR|nr:uncharacterized protein SPOG_00939 [Schizosaccharomyces cryophilus OY26]EPY50178.1 hypothetical protein SPOG_00939 [Schizosaccharomyces cryophilus OY26]